MAVLNTEIADTFSRIADLLDIRGENPYRVRAYRSAARTIGGLSENVSDMVESGENLTSLPGIGKDLAEKARTIVRTGALPQLEKLREEGGDGLIEMMHLPGVGPKKVKALHNKLDISSIEELEHAAREQRLRILDGFGEKTERAILGAIARRKTTNQRAKLPVARQAAEQIVRYLKKQKGLEKIAVAGSFRRQVETVGDLDILATCSRADALMERFVSFEDVEKIIAKGTTKSSIWLRSGLQVDLRIVPKQGYGAALHYFTGSKAHNIATRKIAAKKKMKMNEYGVYKGNERVAGRTEKEVYAKLGLRYIEPELREDTGEIDAARKGQLPVLVDIEQIRGDLHAHSEDSDGKHTIEEMARAAREKGYEYLAITDHSKRVRVAHGLDAQRLQEQWKVIEMVNKQLKGTTVLRGIEVDVLEDGTLDLPKRLLHDLDIVVAAVHSKFRLSSAKQTERIVRAMGSGTVSILAHPTGRLIGERWPYECDMERIVKSARDEGCALELNAHPDRLDLAPRYCRMAKEFGVNIAVSTDAHSTSDLAYMTYGIGQARRGWLEAGDVLNTRGIDELMRSIEKT
ncbi:MAG: DNA polymerase/3'-5' exonuclease PolX [Chitinivibrionales bacterium]|nr:DNA polymerase/3'-5' exonuclease PolX [Chitinivibrionales bacterium]MBD3396508.1 DNA polymerase/3'-5' exonuclease PolX [Chitinivibrionales bacterium]